MDPQSGALEKLRSRGTVPVFPLPDLVFFPHAALPLHIFEPRYRLMVEDALRGDRMIAMALLRPGWERGYDGTPDLFPLGCAGIIEEEVRLPGGRFNIRLRGLARVEIRSFIQERPYRIGTVRVLEDRNEQDNPLVREEKRRLLSFCAGLLQEFSGRSARPFAPDSEVPFAAAVNTLCQSLVMETTTKMQLLGMDDVVERCRALVSVLEERWREIALIEADGDAPRGPDVH